MHGRWVTGVGDLELKLAEGLDEGHGLNVTHGPSKLDDAHVGRTVAPIHRHLGHTLNPVLDGVGYVGHHLHRLAQVVPPPLPLYHRLQVAPS
jgi:hypothetical protein